MIKRPHRIAMLVFDDFLLLDAAGPIGAFEMVEHFIKPGYRIDVIATVPSVRSSSSVTVAAKLLRDADPFDTLLVVGGIGSDRAMLDAQLLECVRAAHRRGARLVSVCTGAFVLAAAGVLDGKRATTHWAEAQRFARTFPLVQVEEDRIYIQQGQIWTAAGVSAGIDLALALIGEDYGEAIASRIAESMVVYHRRPGGQPQASALLRIARPTSRFAAVISWAREHLGERLCVAQMADQAALSERQFSRAFIAELGISPAKAIEALRVEAARIEIENSATRLESIAERSGFSSVDSMRRAFVRVYGQAPQDMRRTSRERDSHHDPLPKTRLRIASRSA